MPDDVTLDNNENVSRFDALRLAVADLRTWIGANPLKGAIVALASIAMLTTTVLAWHWLTRKALIEVEPVTLEEALEALDGDQREEARDLARTLRYQADLAPEELGGPSYVTGMVLARAADDAWSDNKQRNYLLAARHLEEARQLGFPAGRRSKGLVTLGRSLYLGGRYEDAIPVLVEALTADPSASKLIHRLLATAYTTLPDPNWREALHHLTRFLQTSELDERQRQKALLDKVEALLGLQQREAADDTLEQLPKGGPLNGHVLIARARIKLQQLGQQEAKGNDLSAENGSEESTKQAERLAAYSDVLKLLEEAEKLGSPGSEVDRQAALLIGKTKFEMGDYQGAKLQLERTYRRYFQSDEGFAARLLLADLLRKLGEDNRALHAYREVFAAAGEPKAFSNTWLSLKEFRDRMVAAYKDYIDRNDYRHAMGLLGGFAPMFDYPRVVELRAETDVAWALHLAMTAETLPVDDSDETIRDARYHYRRAGYTYGKLAELRRATRAYPDELWNSGNALMAGHDYRNAIRLFNEYLKQEARRRRPQALFNMGKAALSLGFIEHAVGFFTECIEYYPHDAVTFDARIWCAMAYQEQDNFESAETLLLDNLGGDTLTPASIEWRDSLFKLGRLYHGYGRYEEAVTRLEEAIARYPNTPQALEAMYLVASSRHRAAREPQERMQSAQIESVRITSRKRSTQLLTASLEDYQKLQRELLHLQEEQPLTELQNAMLCNTDFAIGSVLFDLGEYEQAIAAYTSASSRHQDEPVVLEAFRQIAHCYRRLGKPLEARGALEQAKVVIKRFDDNADFTKTTNHTHQQWVALLDRLSSW